MATFSSRLGLETATLAEEIERLSKQVDDALKEASAKEKSSLRRLGFLQTRISESNQHETTGSTTLAETSWVDDIVTLESAKAVLRGHGPGGDLRKFMKSRTPSMLGLFLGESCNVSSLRRDEAIRIKHEYQAFRNRSAYIMIAFSALLYVGVLRSRRVAEAGEPLTLLPIVMVGMQVFLCWLLFFYTASALRESVLKVNGSHIRSWWIYHHVWAGITCILMLSLPVDSPSFVNSVILFQWWGMMQGATMLLQNRYQRRRMYTRIALGKSSAMDVVAGEASDADTELLLLYPILFAMQALQSYIGIEMLTKTYWALLSLEGFLDPEKKESDLWGSRGVALAGLLMIYMAIKNFYYTIETAVAKLRAKRQARMRVQALRLRGQRSCQSPEKMKKSA